MALSAEALARCIRLADSGNPDAQIVMAWEYFKGELVPKDLDRAVAFFRAAEPAKGKLARFNLAKAKILSSDKSFDQGQSLEDLLREDCAAGFGPALYLMGVAEARGICRERNVDQAVRYFSKGALNGHLFCEIFAWRLQRKSLLSWIVTSPYAVCLTFRLLAIRIRDRGDIRVLI